MKSWCIRDSKTSHVLKIVLTEEEFEEYLEDNPNIQQCVDCIECDDAPSITLE